MSGSDALIFLLQTLKEVLINYKNIKEGARFELEELQKELGQLVAHLNDAAMSKKSYTSKEIDKIIRELVYEVEDTIETYLTKKAAEKKKNFFCKVPEIFSTKLEEEVKRLRDKKVAHALKLVRLPESGIAEAGEGSTRFLKKENTISNASIREAPNEVESIYKALELDQRVCFLYTALFPQDHEISASTLIQLWIAERFIRPKNQLSLEETAKEILDVLIHKKLLIAEKMRLDQVKTCHLSATSREFCERKSKEENLFTVIERRVHLEQSLYRLCFHSDPSTFLSEKPNFKYVRSFLCLVKEPLCLNPTHISTIPKAFKPLRILNCRSTKFEELPKNITSLILLKHITLSIDNLKFLPEEISKLSNLQTLIVETGSKTIVVKVNIWKMVQLRHLKTKATFLLDDKKWKGEGAAAKDLLTISRLSPESCSVALSEKAPNLKSLGIQGILSGLDLDALSLQKFRYLEKLKLMNYVDYGLASDSPLLSLPRVDRFPQELKRLTLSNTYLVWNIHMTILAKIHHLEVLKLKDNSFKGASWNARVEDEFSNLHFLLIENTDLNTWKASTDNFPTLKWLVIKKCKKFKNVPESLAKKVEKLDIDEESRNQKLK